MKRLKYAAVYTLLSCLIMLSVSGIQISSNTDSDSLYDNSLVTPIEGKTCKENGMSVFMSENSKIFDYIDKIEFDDRKFVARDVQSEELNTYVFLNDDGTKTVYLLGEDVKFVDENGDIREKNIDLVEKDNLYETKENDVFLSLPKVLKDGVMIGYKDLSLKMMALTDDVSAIASREGNSVIYKNIFSEGIDLKYTPLLSGVKEEIIINMKVDVTEFSFFINTDLDYYEEEGKIFFSKSASSDNRIYIEDIIVYDNSGKNAIGDIELGRTDDGYIVNISVEEDFLNDETTVYPVTIDPTATISENSQGTYIQDSTISQANGSTNYGSYIYNTMGTYSGLGVTRTAVRLYGLELSTQFSTLTWDQIETASLYIKDASGFDSRSIVCYKLLGEQTWTENTVTWNTLGTIDGSSACSATITNGDWTAVNIKTLLQMWKVYNYQSYCMCMQLSNSESSQYVQINSSDNTSNKPYVIFTYDPITVDRMYFDYSETTTYKDFMKLKQNCYGYAIQVFCPETNYKQHPGEFSNNYPSYSSYDSAYRSVMLNNALLLQFLDSQIKSDFATLSVMNSEWTILDTTASASVPSGYRKIAMVVGQFYSPLIGYYGDFHFYLRASNGRWSHKPGHDDISYKSFSKVVINDSNINTVASDDGYSGGIKYYLISKPAIDEYRGSDAHSTGSNWPAVMDSVVPGGNIIKKAVTVTTGNTKMYIDYPGDMDYFEYTPSVSGMYVLCTTGTSTSSVNLNIRVYDSGGGLLSQNINSTGDTGLVRNLNAGETYFIEISIDENTTCYTYLSISII